MRTREPCPGREITQSRRSVEAQEAPGGLCRGRSLAQLGEQVATPRVTAHSRAHPGEAPEHGRDVVGPIAAAPRKELRTHAGAQFRMELVLRQRTTSGKGGRRRVNHLVQRVDRGDPLPAQLALERRPELLAELVLFVGDEGPA